MILASIIKFNYIIKAILKISQENNNRYCYQEIIYNIKRDTLKFVEREKENEHKNLIYSNVNLLYVIVNDYSIY